MTWFASKSYRTGSLALRPSKQSTPINGIDRASDFLALPKITGRRQRPNEMPAIGFVVVEHLAAMSAGMAARVID